jgi:hypothetical protein
MKITKHKCTSICRQSSYFWVSDLETVVKDKLKLHAAIQSPQVIRTVIVWLSFNEISPSHSPPAVVQTDDLPT